jgi:hypothetical protein
VISAPDKIKVVLDAVFSRIEVSVYETYIFEEPPGELEIAGVLMITESGTADQAAPDRPLFVIEHHSTPISSCMSVRQNDDAAECYTFTEAGFRQLGYGRKVTAAWGRWHLLRGRVPFYSHASDNRGSKALAESLGLSWKFRLTVFR